VDDGVDDDTLAPPNTGCNHLSEAEKLHIIEGRAQNHSVGKIAGELGRSKSTVSAFHKKWRSANTLARASGQGRKRKTNERDDRLIMSCVKQNRFVTTTEIQANQRLPRLSLSTIRARIKETGEFASYWATKKPFISLANQRKRVAWCIERLNWTREQWRQVMCTDESPVKYTMQPVSAGWLAI